MHLDGAKAELLPCSLQRLRGCVAPLALVARTPRTLALFVLRSRALSRALRAALAPRSRTGHTHSHSHTYKSSLFTL